MVRKTGEAGSAPDQPSGDISPDLTNIKNRVEKVSELAAPPLIESKKKWDYEAVAFKTDKPEWVVDAEKFGSNELTLRMPEDKNQEPAAQSAMPVNRVAQLVFAYLITPFFG